MKINWSFQNVFLTIQFFLIAFSVFGANTPAAGKSLDGRTVFNLNVKSSTFSYCVRFKNSVLIDYAPLSTLPWAKPWRVIALGNNCGDILESSLVTHLAEASKLTDLSWIKPGKTSWSWWSDKGSPRNFESLKRLQLKNLYSNYIK